MKNISTILVANRGEIASRVFRTCKKMGIRSVAVYSDADRLAPFVKDADLAIHIGKSSPDQSYLDQEKIINAAKRAKANAIHPGYGFLSENAVFARRCEAEDIIFIGPNATAIEKMGSKSEAKTIMQSYDVPTVPGYQGKDQSLEQLSSKAYDIGFPILLKATAGGGGRGMRIVYKAEELERSINAAKRESKSAFGDDRLIIEKYIESGRHIEFQIFGDQHGNLIHLFERECSLQRRYQKIVEESPSPIMDNDLRSKMSKAALQAAKALNYDNAGTVEFIYDEASGDFYFLEVNTRLQVEHPVTEEITGLDLVQMQIECAQGQELTITQSEVLNKGYAIEARLYAEDPDNNFMPVTGTIQKFELPKVEGLRIESAVASGSEISIFYDPMIAKIIVWGNDRSAAIRKLNYVLRNLICQGITTNLPFLIDLTENEQFQLGQYNTHFVQKFQDTAEDHSNSQQKQLAYIAASMLSWKARQSDRQLLSNLPSGWRNNFYEGQHDTYIDNGDDLKVSYTYKSKGFTFDINEHVYQVSLITCANNHLRLEIDGVIYLFNILAQGPETYVQNEAIGNYTVILKDRYPASISDTGSAGYRTPMPAQIVKVLVNSGDSVHEGDDLIIISSMKMESSIQAQQDGYIEEIYAIEGKNVGADFELLKFKE